VSPSEPVPTSWFESPQYAPFLDEWKLRPEYSKYIKK
jgi:hypothetical protein